MGADGIMGGPGEAGIFAGEGSNLREKVRDDIYRLRRDLWNVESTLKTLEGRTTASVDPARLKPEFSKMFDELVKVMQDYYGLTMAAYGEDFMQKVVNDFNRRFDHLRKKAGG